MADLTKKEIIAKRAACELKNGDVVNLGIGIPSLVSNFLPAEKSVIFQAENGILGMGAVPEKDKTDVNVQNASAQFTTPIKGASFFDSVTSFGMIRGGHIDAVILGAFEVDEEGSLSSWIIPGGKVSGMGGSMDLVVGAKKVIIAMQHTQNGRAKIVPKCTLPYTARKVVDLIITEMAVIKVTPKGLVLVERHPDYSVREICDATACPLIIQEPVREMKI